ncbi:MAG: hypothetical protein ABW321_21515 [Polyangiales bacterium]
MKRALIGLFLLACALLCVYVLDLRAAPKPARKPVPASGRESERLQPMAAVVDPSQPVHYLAVGGGATPEYTEISLEQDLELAVQTLPGPGLVLFAGGSDSSSVRVRAAAEQRPSLLARLGEVFDPRAGRDSHYRRTRLAAQPATSANFETSLSLAASSGTEPLLLYIAAHGLQGDTPRDNHVELWGGEPITVARLDELTSSATRPLRFVIASCYSGGFAELAFAHADPQRGPVASPRCGLFAGPWDRQTSGCDPNPDRRAQEGYSLHFLRALRGEDREGKPLPLRTLDLDGDGEISLLEAHTRARIASHSIDVPTTTSERYLREVMLRKAAPNWKLLPEEAAVVKQLGARLKLTNPAAVDKRYRELAQRVDDVHDELDSAEDELDQARARLAALLLARWPVLGDAYHDEFASTLAQAGADIEQVLKQSPVAEAYRRARDEADAIAARANALDPDEAEVLRLFRAYETAALAASLAERGGAPFAHYQALLACERGAP